MRWKRRWRALRKDGLRATWAAAMQRTAATDTARLGSVQEGHWALARLTEQPGKRHAEAWRLQAHLVKLEAKMAAKDEAAAVQQKAFEEMRSRLKELEHNR